MRRTVGAAKTSRSRRGPTGVAFVGVGYVADLYLATFRNWRERLALKGVFDTSPERQRAFCSHYGVGSYDKLEDMLADPDVEIVVNLTPLPRPIRSASPRDSPAALRTLSMCRF